MDNTAIMVSSTSAANFVSQNIFEEAQQQSMKELLKELAAIKDPEQQLAFIMLHIMPAFDQNNLAGLNKIDATEKDFANYMNEVSAAVAILNSAKNWSNPPTPEEIAQGQKFEAILKQILSQAENDPNLSSSDLSAIKTIITSLQTLVPAGSGDPDPQFSDFITKALNNANEAYQYLLKKNPAEAQEFYNAVLAPYKDIQSKWQDFLKTGNPADIAAIVADTNKIHDVTQQIPQPAFIRDLPYDPNDPIGTDSLRGRVIYDSGHLSGLVNQFNDPNDPYYPEYNINHMIQIIAGPASVLQNLWVIPKNSNDTVNPALKPVQDDLTQLNNDFSTPAQMASTQYSLKTKDEQTFISSWDQMLQNWYQQMQNSITATSQSSK